MLGSGRGWLCGEGLPVRAMGLAGHSTGARWCWWLQMLSPAPLVPESKQERSLKSLFPLKCRLKRLYLFTEIVYLLSHLEALSCCACR